MTTKLRITRNMGMAHAICLNCDDMPLRATRERARVHASRTGHTVQFTTSEHTLYAPQAPADVDGGQP